MQTTSQGNRKLHDYMRTYFDQPREFTYSGEIEPTLRGKGAKFALKDAAHGTLALARTPLRKTERKSGINLYKDAPGNFVRPYSAPAHRAAALTTPNGAKTKKKGKLKAEKPAWNDQHHIAIPGILRNRIHTGWCTQPTWGNNLRATDTYLLEPEKALEQALAATIYDMRDGALTVRNRAR